MFLLVASIITVDAKIGETPAMKVDGSGRLDLPWLGASVSLPGEPVVSVLSNKTVIDYGGKQVEAYETRDGVEYMIIVKDKPGSSRVSFNVEDQGLNWLYQGPLTDYYSSGYSEYFNASIKVTESTVRDSKTGELLVYRPPWAVGSYAIYDADYMKVGHLYVPRVWDEGGHEYQGRWVKDGGSVYVDLPDKWFSESVGWTYVDPFFGYLLAGASMQNREGRTTYMIGSPGADGVVESVHVCVNVTMVPKNAVSAIYNSSGGKIGGDSTVTQCLPDGAQTWRTLTFPTGPEVTGDKQHFIGAQWENAAGFFQVYYDNGAPSHWHDQVTGWLGVMPDQIAAANDTFFWSMYATYSTLTMNVQAVDDDGAPLENVTVAVWNTGGDLVLSGFTNATGFLSLVNASRGDYTAQGGLSGYSSVLEGFSFSASGVTVLTLTGLENVSNGAVFMAAFVSLNLLCTYTMFVARSLTLGIIGGVFGFIFWLVTAQYWLHLETTVPVIAYLFYAGSTLCIVWTGYSSFLTMRGS